MGSSAVIFVAKVLVDSGEGWGKGPAKVAIVEPLQNVPKGLEETTISTMSGTSCYFRLKAGEQYIVVTEAGHYGVGGCSPSVPLHGNEHILDAMRSRLKGDPPVLTGKVLKSTGTHSHQGGIPMVAVELEANGVKRSTTTDSQGAYSIPGLDAGSYKLRLAKPGYAPDDEFNNRWSGRMRINPTKNAVDLVKDVPGEIVIEPQACTIRDLAMWPAGRIEGTVRGSDGKPLRAVPVQAFEFDQRGERQSSPLRTAVTDSSGAYRLEPLPSGRFAVGVNARKYDDDNPYPPTLYNAGQPMHVDESGVVTGIDLVVGPPRKPARILVKAVGPYGHPRPKAIVALETPAGVQRYYSREETDVNGELAAPAYEGESYIVKAHYFNWKEDGAVELEGSARVDVTGPESMVTIVMKARQSLPLRQ